MYEVLTQHSVKEIQNNQNPSLSHSYDPFPAPVEMNGYKQIQ